MNTNTLKKLIKEEIRSILKEGEHDQQNYMFFQNLHTIKKMVEKMLALNPQEVDALLSNGHAWAVDHISTSADDVGEVGTWMCNELGRDMNNTNMMSESNSRNDIANYIIILSNRLIVAKEEGDQKMIDTLTKCIADLKNELNSLKETNSSEPALWKKSGFKSEEEYNKFLDTKMKGMMDKIKSDPKLLSVFKRLNDK